jgi:hypothetical protein
MMTDQIYGWHITPHGTNEADILARVHRSGSRTHTVLHSAGLARKVYDECIAAGVKDPIIILRADWPDSDWNAAPFNNPDKFVADRAHLVGDWGYLEYLCEPIATSAAQLTDLLNKCIAFMTACVKYGVKGAVGGFADAATFQQAWLQAGLFNPFLRVAVTWTRAGHGVIIHHDYSEGCPMKNGGGHSHTDMLDPSKMQPSGFPTAAEMQQPAPGGWLDFSAQAAPNFDLDIAYQAAIFLTSERGLRPEHQYAHQLFFDTHGVSPDEFLQTTFFVQAVDFNWTAMRYMQPLIWARMLMGEGYLLVVGEYGPQDDMPHLRVIGFTAELERVAAGGRKRRGPLEQADFYAFWWPGISREVAHIRILRWQASVIPPECLGYTLFALNPDWPSFNYLLWPTFWPIFYVLTDELRRLSVAITPVPKPANAGEGKQANVQTGTFINWRDAPDTSAAPIGKLLQGDAVTWYPASVKNEDGTPRFNDGYDWAWVEKGTLGGWAARVHPTWEAQYKEVVVVPPPPPPDPIPDPVPPPPAPPALVSVWLTIDEFRQITDALIKQRDGMIQSRNGLTKMIETLATQIRIYEAALARAMPSASAAIGTTQAASATSVPSTMQTASEAHDLVPAE